MIISAKQENNNLSEVNPPAPALRDERRARIRQLIEALAHDGHSVILEAYQGYVIRRVIVGGIVEW